MGQVGNLPADYNRPVAELSRNLRRAGIGSDVGRKITGHETTSMWTRYSIVDETDVAAALDKVGAFVSQQVAKAPRKVIAFPQR